MKISQLGVGAQRPRHLPLVLGMVAALSIGACAGKETDGGTAASPGPTSTVAASPVVDATPGAAGSGTRPATPRPAASSELPDGRSPAYLTSINVAKRTVTFDLIEFLTGDAAKEAFKKAHPDSGEEGPPNDYFIVNDNPRLRTMPVANPVSITVMQENDPTKLVPLAFDEAPAYFAKHAAEAPAGRLAWTPFWLTVKGGQIVKLEQQFLP